MSYRALVGGTASNSQFNPHASGGFGRSQGPMYSRAANNSSAYFNSQPPLDNMSTDYDALRTPGVHRQPGRHLHAPLTERLSRGSLPQSQEVVCVLIDRRRV